MNPINQIKLTNHHYVNPNAVAAVEFHAAGERGDRALFFAIFSNTEIQPLSLQGQEAEQAIRNWSGTHERNLQEK